MDVMVVEVGIDKIDFNHMIRHKLFHFVILLVSFVLVVVVVLWVY